MKRDKYRIQCCDRALDLGGRAKVMGVLNVTPDSFYDGGVYWSDSRKKNKAIDCAVQRALDMTEAGAEIIDIGGESTRPGAKAIDAEEEIRRTVPVIRELRNQSNVLLSIDTYKAAVAEQALLAGAEIVNDISGFAFDPALAEVCTRHNAAAILMHNTGRPEAMQWSHEIQTAGADIVARVQHSLRCCVNNAEKQGVRNLILDPGFGFGKSVAENYELLRRLQELHALERPLLAGLSRKSFLAKAVEQFAARPLQPPEDRLTATGAANTIALLNGANILRVHDVREAVETLAVTTAASAP